MTSSPWLVANLLGLITLPLAFWQFGLSQTKTEFLLINFGTCLLWAGSLWLTQQDTAAAVSFAAGTASIFQTVLIRMALLQRPEYAKWRRSGQITVAVLSISIAVCLAPPVGLWNMVPVVAFIWIRGAETLTEIPMRVLSLASPLVWAMIAWHGQNYTLMPVDAIALGSGLWWFYRRRQKRSIQASAEIFNGVDF
jgi:Flp pilus assembly protein TadB